LSDHPTVTRGAIIAGGGATRFGGHPKGLETVGGRRILDRLVEAFQEALGHTPLLVANDPEATSWHPDLRVVPDAKRGLGALGGIYTACLAAPAPVVVAAWDMPFVPPGLLRALAAGLDGADTCLPESGSRRGVEPLLAAYGPSVAPAIEATAARGDLRAIGFHRDIKTSILPSRDVRRYGNPDLLFFNVNTPDDLREAERLWRTHASFPSSG